MKISFLDQPLTLGLSDFYNGNRSTSTYLGQCDLIDVRVDVVTEHRRRWELRRGPGCAAVEAIDDGAGVQAVRDRLANAQVFDTRCREIEAEVEHGRLRPHHELEAGIGPDRADVADRKVDDEVLGR